VANSAGARAKEYRFQPISAAAIAASADAAVSRSRSPRAFQTDPQLLYLEFPGVSGFCFDKFFVCLFFWFLDPALRIFLRSVWWKLGGLRRFFIFFSSGRDPICAPFLPSLLFFCRIFAAPGVRCFLLSSLPPHQMPGVSSASFVFRFLLSPLLSIIGEDPSQTKLNDLTRTPHRKISARLRVAPHAFFFLFSPHHCENLY